MADYLTTLVSPRGTLFFNEPAQAATLNSNIFAKNSPTIFGVIGDATSNTTEDVYIKFYSGSSDATVGSTDPVMVLKVPAGTKVEFFFPDGATGENSEYVSIAVVQESGTAGTTAPTGTVAVTVLGA